MDKEIQGLKEAVHSDINLFLIEGEKWEKQVSESLSKNPLRNKNVMNVEGAIIQAHISNSETYLTFTISSMLSIICFSHLSAFTKTNIKS